MKRPTRITRPAISFQPEARNQFYSGIAAVADMLAVGLGPLSGHVLVDDTTRKRVETLDDAATTLRRIISLGQADLDVGAMLVRGVIWQLEQRVGDGGKSAAILLHELVSEGMRQVTAGASAMRLIAGLRRGADVAAAAVRTQARPVLGERNLAAVARTLTHDDALAAILGEMSYLLGADGYLHMEMHVAPYLERVYIGGARYAATCVSAYFYSEPERKRAVAAAPAMVLLDKPLAEAEQALTLLNILVAADHKHVVVVAPEISGAALNLLVANHMQPVDKRKIAIMGVKLSAVGDELRTALQDLALMTGATVLGDANVRPIRAARAADIGTANRVEFADASLIVTATGERRNMVQHEIAAARRRLAALAYDDSERPALIRRLAALSGGLGVLKIGDYYSTGRDLRRAQAERAWKVLSAVQRGGVVPGGGATLLHCQTAVLAAADHEADADVALGMRVLAHALPAPQRQILLNASVAAPAVYLHRLQTAGAPAAFDVLSSTVVDAHAQGLLDATDVVLGILDSAVSGATMALSTDTIVYHRKPKQSTTP